ncbi:AAA ATPase midasin, partial [Coemansia thaxteri]
MAALPEQKRGSGVDLVERGLERLGIATQLATEGSSSSNNMAEDSSRAAEDSTDSAPGEAGSVVRSMHGAIRITDIDPLSIDLAAAITRLLEQIGSGCSATAVPAAGSDIVRRLGAWAQAPKHETTGDVLNQLSALLLAEGFDGDTLAALPTDGLPSAARWGDGRFTLAVGAAFRPILIDLVARWAAAEAPAAVFRHLSAHAASERVDVGVAYAAGCLVATAPQTRSLVMRYFAARGGACIAQQAVAAQDAAQALRVLVVAYRLLRRVPELAGSGACGWAAPLTQLMGPDRAPAVRMVACACLCVAQGFSDHGRARLVASMRLDGAAVAGTLAWLVHGERAFDAAAGAALVAANRAGDFSAAANRSVPQELLSSGVACAGGVLLASAGAARAGAGLVETPAVARNIHGMALAASRGAAVLLQGAAGSGKTALVAWLARRAGVELVTIHVSSSMDAKVLLGNYVTTQAAGGFEWRAGLLTTAVAEGHWVLIEDVDLAPSDVVQTLVPLLESNTLFVPSRGEAVPAHVHFRLFATLSTHGTRGARAGADGLLGSSVWTRVEIAPLDSEMPLIIAGVFPPLAPHADMLAQAFGRVAAAAGLPLSTGDLLKWCRRLSAYGNDTFSLFKEAVDAFAMREADYTRWRAAVHAIGTVFGLSRQRVDTHIDQSSPTTSTSGRVLRIGHASLGIEDSAAPAAAIDRMPFADTHHARSLLERIAACVQLGEPALLSGETGTGKTTVVQHLASLAGRPLAVFNLSQQSDSSDLLGGFRPVDVALLALRLREEFDPLFARTVSVSKNAAFLDNVRVAHGKKDWRRLAALLRKAADNAAKVLDAARQAVECGSDAGPALKRQKVSAESIDELEKAWASFKAQVADFEAARGAKMVFRFVEGALVRAARSGTWILLDEINLATAETLACLGGLLQRERTLLLAETGVRIACHPDFRLIACMNPANDVGKRELPPGLRSSFTEIFVHPPDASSDDLLAIVRSHLPANAPPAVCHRVIAFYRAAKRLAAEHRLVDGAAQRPHYSLRTLTRSLTYARENAAAYSLKRALYDGLFMMFVTQLEAASQAVLVAELHAVFHGDDIRQLLARAPPPPPSSSAAEAPVLVQGFWLPAAPAAADVADAEADDSYVITASVEAKIKSLARAVMCGRYPVLIQGTKSAGKTSMVQHLARRTGHRF